MAGEFNRGLERFSRKLERLDLQTARVDVVKGLELIGEKTAKRAAQLTPRSDGPGPHVADGWQSKTKRGPDGTVVEVSNGLAKANEELALKGGGSTTLLHILEFGSAPHEIVPKNKKFLKFSVAGGVVFTKKVQHPGTRPYSMLTIAQTEAAEDLKRLIDLVRSKIRGRA